MGEKTQTYLDNTGQNHYNYFAKMVFVCAPRNFAGAKERNDLNMANMKKEYKMSAERKEELQKELTYLKTEQKRIIVELMTENPAITRIEIAEKMGMHESSVQRRLESLVRDGCIRHIGPTNGGVWEITEKK